MIGRRQYGSRFAFAAITSLLFAACTAQAQVSVTPTVGSSGGLFHYDYSVTNMTGNEVILVDVDVPQDPLAVQNPTAPTGFKIAFDPGLGLVSFLEDSDLFSTTPVSGFTFDSIFGPGSTPFQATFIDPATGGLGTLPGITIGPTAVPEPGSLATLAALALSGTLLLRRRKAAHA